MMQKDVALGILAAAVTISGLILVFCGFLFSKAAEYSDIRRGDKFRAFAKVGAVPLLASFTSSWVCIMAVQDNTWAVTHGILIFQIALVISAVYSIISLLSL